MNKSILYLFLSIIAVLVALIGWELYNSFDSSQSEITGRTIIQLESDEAINDSLLNHLVTDPNYFRHLSN